MLNLEKANKNANNSNIQIIEHENNFFRRWKRTDGGHDLKKRTFRILI